MKRRGPRHSPGEKHLMTQVARVFTLRKKEKDGAKRAAKELGISLASFYKYAAGDDLPRMEVLRAAQQKWKGVKWDLIDVSKLLKKRAVLAGAVPSLFSPRGSNGRRGNCKDWTKESCRFYSISAFRDDSAERVSL